MSGWQTGAFALTAILLAAGLVALLAGRADAREAASAWDADFAKAAATGLAGGGLAGGTGGKGIYLGFSVDQPKGKPPLELAYTGDRHIMTFGPNGAGKSMRLLYENLIRLEGWSVVVVDPKGDLARHTLDKRRAMGGRIIVLDPFGVSGFASDGYNPIAALADDDSLAGSNQLAFWYA